MKKTKILILICSAVVVICTAVVGIIYARWGDIWQVRDLAEIIGWENINHVICTQDGIDLELNYTSYKQNLSDTEKEECTQNPLKYILAHLEIISDYLNSNGNYNGRKFTVQYGNRPDDSGIGRNPVITFRNFSFNYQVNYSSGYILKNEVYDGFYAMLLDGGYAIDFDDFSEAPWNNMREMIFYSYSLPDNPEEITNLTALEFVYFRVHIGNDECERLRAYAPWCDIVNGA